MHRVRSLFMVVVGPLVLLTCCGGCGSPNETTIAPLWQTYINNALNDPLLTDFEREVLSDYQVTDAEYQEARARFRDCMADLGWVVTDKPEDGYSIQGAPGTSNQGRTPHPDVVTGCEIGSTFHIEPIYIGMRDNPAGRTWADDVRACFEANGISDGAGFTDDQFTDMINDPDYHPSTPEGKLCVHDPTGSADMTIEEAEALDADTSVPATCTPGIAGTCWVSFDNSGAPDNPF